MDESHPAYPCFYNTKDPHSPDGFPALTTVLHKVCNQNPEKFDEACRLIGLFMNEAYERGKRDGQRT